MTASEAVGWAAIQAAMSRLHGVVHRTPVFTSSSFDRRAGRRVLFKCENLQKTGAFKFRGASNAVRLLAPSVASRGVVTHSSGNHAQALALAAQQRGIPAYIVMPHTAAAVKRHAVAAYGGQITLCAPSQADRELTAARIAEQTGAVLIPPFDHPDVIAGQGTVAWEFLEQAPELEALVIPVGGGGLIAGCAMAAQKLRPTLRIFGAEPAGADDAARSKAAGQWLPQTAPNTIADGLRTSTGQLTWPIIRDRVEHIFTVSDDDIRATMRWLWERLKLIVEPSGAVPAAVVLSDAFRSLPGLPTVGVILSGGNVDLDTRYW
jgi:threonine dehydratase/serine racemase